MKKNHAILLESQKNEKEKLLVDNSITPYYLFFKISL